METNLLLSDLINFSGVKATIVSPSGSDLCGSGLEIMGITSNSNEVNAGFLFAALHGSNFDGAQFVPEAVARGAVAILINETSEILSKPITVHAISTDSPRRLFALMSAKLPLVSEDPVHDAIITSPQPNVSFLGDGFISSKCEYLYA